MVCSGLRIRVVHGCVEVEVEVEVEEGRDGCVRWALNSAGSCDCDFGRDVCTIILSNYRSFLHCTPNPR